jgi:hypothetical protein
MSELAKAILGVMEDVAYVQKGGRVSGGGMNYSFAGEADLLRALRPAMVRRGLALLPVGCAITEHHEVHDGKYGAKQSRTVRCVSTYRLLHASGESVDLQVAGEGQDGGDKATAKALTISLKYALRQAFLIETGDDPDRVRPEGADLSFAEAVEACKALLRAQGCDSAGKATSWLQERSEGQYSAASVESEPFAVLKLIKECLR